jgi:hypothetical protein
MGEREGQVEPTTNQRINEIEYHNMRYMKPRARNKSEKSENQNQRINVKKIQNSNQNRDEKTETHPSSPTHPPSSDSN